MIDSIKKLIDKYDDKSLEEPDYYFQYVEFVEDLKSLLEFKQKIQKNEKSLVIAFVQGAKWWEFEKTKFTMWQSDALLAEEEATRKLKSRTLGKTMEEIIETTKTESKR